MLHRIKIRLAGNKPIFLKVRERLPKVPHGPSDRTMRTQREYRKYQKTAFRPDGCVLCDPAHIEILEDFNFFIRLAAKFQYEIWDDHIVSEHYMIVPKAHRHTILEFTPEEKSEYMELLGRFESEGYSFYSRAPGDTTRSVAHFHTHLLRISGSSVEGMLYLRKPHVVLYRKRKS